MGKRGRKPGPNYFALGQRMAMQLEGVCTYAQIAKELGVTHQYAYKIAMVALGKLAYGLENRLQPAGVNRVHN